MGILKLVSFRGTNTEAIEKYAVKNTWQQSSALFFAICVGILEGAQRYGGLTVKLRSYAKDRLDHKILQQVFKMHLFTANNNLHRSPKHKMYPF